MDRIKGSPSKWALDDDANKVNGTLTDGGSLRERVLIVQTTGDSYDSVGVYALMLFDKLVIRPHQANRGQPARKQLADDVSPHKPSRSSDQDVFQVLIAVYHVTRASVHPHEDIVGEKRGAGYFMVRIVGPSGGLAKIG